MTIMEKIKRKIIPIGLSVILPLIPMKLLSKGNADFQYNEDKTQIRTTLNFKNLDVNAMKITEEDSNYNAILRATAKSNLFGGKAYLTGKINTKKSDGNTENLYHISPAFGKGIFYVEPVWTSFNEDLEITEVDPFLQINTKVKGMDVQGAGVLLIPTEGKNSSAGYIAIKNDKNGIGFSKGYNDNFGLQFGSKREDGKGLAGIIDYDPETGDWNLTSYLSEKACGAVGPGCPELWGDYVVIGRPSETAPYFTGTANKTTKGLAGKIKTSLNETEFTSVYAELGYNTGEGFGVSFGQKYDFETEESTADATATYKVGAITVEGKLDDKGKLKVYTSYEWE